METLDELEKDLERALKVDDFETVASVRRSITQLHPDTTQAAEAHYKLGLDALFRQRSLDAAAEHFRASAKLKIPQWGLPARMSLGLVLLRQGKPQQAIFELRRVAGVESPTAQSAQAAGMVVVALLEQGKSTEAERARQQHRRILDRLCKQGDGVDAALGHFMLGIEKKFDGDRAGAKASLLAAQAMGDLPDE
ncbi:MAG: tetratricopeptide repeat protein, partial [Myxococcota bacterium]